MCPFLRWVGTHRGKLVVVSIGMSVCAERKSGKLALV